MGIVGRFAKQGPPVMPGRLVRIFCSGWASSSGDGDNSIPSMVGKWQKVKPDTKGPLFDLKTRPSYIGAVFWFVVSRRLGVCNRLVIQLWEKN